MNRNPYKMHELIPKDAIQQIWRMGLSTGYIIFLIASGVLYPHTDSGLIVYLIFPLSILLVISAYKYDAARKYELIFSSIFIIFFAISLFDIWNNFDTSIFYQPFLFLVFLAFNPDQKKITFIAFLLAGFIAFLQIFLTNVWISPPIMHLVDPEALISVMIIQITVAFFSNEIIARYTEHLNKSTLSTKTIQDDLELQIKQRAQMQSRIAGIISLNDIKTKELENTQRALLNVLEDIDEEKEISERERLKLNAILQSIGDGVIVLNSTQEIVLVNKLAEKVTGFPAKTLIGSKMGDKLIFTFAKEPKKIVDVSGPVFDTPRKEFSFADIQLQIRNKRKIFVNLVAAPLFDEHEIVIGCVLAFRDATREHEIDKMKTEFVSIASHQLKTPLTAIKWVTEMLMDEKDGKLTEAQKALLIDLNNSNERMIDLVNNLLSVSRIETGRNFEILKEKCNLSMLMKQIIEQSVRSAEKRKVKIILNESFPNALELNLDKQKMEQALSNVLSNAIKYSLNKGKVVVGSLPAKKNTFVMYIKDEGIGIPLKQQGRVFQKFFRADNVFKIEAEGNGLGLYIVKAIVEEHGGKIWFKSQENKGSIFFIELPV